MLFQLFSVLEDSCTILLCSELNEIASKYTRMSLLIKIEVVQAQNTWNIFHGSKDGMYVLLMYQLLYQPIDWVVGKSDS